MRKDNFNLLIRSILFLVALITASAYLFYLPYKVVRQSELEWLNTQQLALAKQSSQGIQSFFEHYEKILIYLSQQPDIVELNSTGKQLMERLYQLNKDQLLALTRVDAEGKIVHTVPFHENSIGLDISGQPHNAFIITNHSPIVSDVFTAVQGYKAVAYAFPVFRAERYAGSLTILIPFDVISQKYLSTVKLGDAGYAWMIDRNGTELFCPVPGHIGKSVFETSEQFPSVLAMVKEMTAGKQGATSYRYDMVREQSTTSIIKQAVYHPVILPNNTWSIVVATPEDQALAAVKEFSLWWLIIFSVFVVIVSIVVLLWARSRFITRESMRKQMVVEKQRESDRLFRLIIRKAHIPIVVVSAEGTIEFVNNQFTELTGYLQEDIPSVEKWFEQAYPNTSKKEALLAQWWSEMNQVYQKQDASGLSYPEIEIVCKDGTTRFVKFDFSLIEKRLLVTFTDLTQQRNIEEEKQRIQERENKAKKIEVVGLMAGSVAHDLNNILSGIVSYPEVLLAQLPLNSPLRGPLEIIKESGTRAAMVVDDLLTTARSAAITFEAGDLNRLIEEYLDSPEHRRLHELHPQVSIGFENKADNAHLLCSPVHIKKTIMNLVTNAAEAIQGDGTITLTTRNHYLTPLDDEEDPSADYVELLVEDTGSGVPKEEIEHIFEPFYTKKIMGRSGSGLGLAIVWNTVQDHNGRVTVSSSRDGTCFKLRFPLAEPGETPILEEIEVESLRGNRERILIVDDEPMLCEIGCQLLRHNNYTVDSVTSGEKALEFIKENPVDLILLDMIMDPGMNGRETYEEILKIRPRQKAIIVSGYADEAEVEKATRLGSGHFLKKPYSSVSLLNAIRSELLK